MFDNKPELTRRKALLALGGVGTGAALGGGATMAFLSDEEKFSGDLTAGKLDLKVDWQEHYSDWSDDETNNLNASMDRDDLENPEAAVGFPSAAAEKFIYTDDKEQFLNNTMIEAFPDTDDDGKQDTQDDGISPEFPSGDICTSDADLDEALSSDLRTNTDDRDGGAIGGPPNAQTTKSGDPLVCISDVKPGDFGELTLSFHLCGNPGYVWLMGELVDASENGTPEPEEKDPDEQAGVVELLDELRVAIWYDTGNDGEFGPGDDGQLEPGEGNNYKEDSEVLLLIGSLRDVLNMLSESLVPLDPTPVASDGSVDPPATFDTCTEVIDDGDMIDDDLDDSPFTNADLGVQNARNIPCTELAEKLNADSNIPVSNANYVGTKIEAPDLGPGIYTAGNGGLIQVDSVDIQGGTVTFSTNFPVKAVGVKGGPEGENNYVLSNQTDGCALDNVTFETPPFTPPNKNEPIQPAISNIEVCFSPDAPSGPDPGPEGRECFTNSTTAYIGFEWWLPVDHANEIQTDSVEFNLGFYTEQCRHNNGLMPSPGLNDTDGNSSTGNISSGPD